MDDILTTAIAGCGNRGGVYSEYALENPDKMAVKAIAEPNSYRRDSMGDRFSIPSDMRFESVSEMIDSGIDVDVVINTTMDPEHYGSSLAILNAGYDMLLEKPICLSKSELMEIYKTAVEKKARVMVCHVLRYSPFYRTIKELVMNGEIGDIHSMVTEENVSYHHFATAFVRGKWADSEKCGSQILMSKCCHDLDIITWLKSGTPPRRVSSYGSLFNFKRENAPEGSGEKCTVDCGISENCEYNAKKMYVDQGLYGFYAREHLDEFPDRDEPGRLEKSLGEGNPYGRCVWRCQNNVFDHQTVAIEFDDGSTASHNLIGGTARPSRTIHLAGTRGEIDGCMEDGVIRLRKPDLAADGQHVEKILRLPDTGDGHGGGDMGLMEDFVKYMKKGKSSISTTELADSIYGHLIGFNAHEALEKNTVAQIEGL